MFVFWKRHELYIWWWCLTWLVINFPLETMVFNEAHTFAAHSFLVSFFWYYTTIILALVKSRENERKELFAFWMWKFFYICWYFNADISFINKTKQLVCRIRWTAFRNRERKREIENRWISENWKKKLEFQFNWFLLPCH